MTNNTLSGTWQKISCNENGVALSSGVDTFTSFEGNRFIVRSRDGTVVIEGFYVLHASMDPKAVDWTDTVGADAGKTFPAIYTVTDDNFAFCAADEGMDRPTGFDAIQAHTIRIFKRAEEI